MGSMGSEPMTPPRRRLLKTVSVCVLFLLALVVTALVHLPTPVGRALVTDGINTGLSDVFFGKVRVSSVEHLGLESVRFASISVVDEGGDRVLHLRDVTVRVALPDLIGALVADSPERLIELPHIRAESAQVTLISDPTDNSVTIARALTPRPTPPPPPRSSRRKTTTLVHLPSIELGRVTGRFKIDALEELVPTLVAVHGSVYADEEGVSVNVQRFGITTTGLPAPVRGTAAVQVRAPSLVDVQFAGFVGRSELHSTFAWRDGAVEASLTSPKLTPHTIRQFIPDWPVVESLALSARASGTFDQLDVEAKVSGSTYTSHGNHRTSEVLARGELAIADPIRATFQTQVSDLTLRLFGPAWPESAIDAHLTTSFSYAGASFTQHTTGLIPATEVANTPVPEITFEVNTAAGQTTLDAKVNEPDANGELHATYLTSGDVTLHLDVPRLYLDRQRRLPRGIRGFATLQLKGQLRGGRAEVDGAIRINQLQASSVSIGQATIVARTSRALDAPTAGTIHVELNGSNVTVGQIKFGTAAARATWRGDVVGATLALSDPDGRRIDVSGNYNVDLSRLTHVTVKAQRADLVGTAELPLIDLHGPTLEMSSLSIHRPNCTLTKCPRVIGSARYAPGRLLAKLDAKNVAFERLWPVLGMTIPVRGMIDADLDVDVNDSEQRATVSVSARQVSYQGFPETGLELKATLSGDAADASVVATNDLGVVIAGKANGRLAGNAMNLSSWERAAGKLELNGRIDTLEPLRLIANIAELRSLDGTVQTKVVAQRLTSVGYPTISAEVDVQGLGLEWGSGKDIVRVSKHRVYVNSTLDPERATLYASGLVEDNIGPLLRVNGQLPLNLNDGSIISKHDALLVNGTLDSRDIGALQYVSTSLSGKLSGQFTLYGTIENPEGKLSLHLVDLMAPALDAQLPLSIQTNVHYALSSGRLTGEVLGVSDRETVVLGKTVGSLDVNDPTFRGSARVALSRFPLSVITPIAELDIDGDVSGMIELADTPAPYVDVQLEVEELTAGTQVLGSSSLAAHAAPGNIRATFDIQQGNNGVFASLEALADPVGFPTPSKVSEVHARLRAEALNAAAFSPLLTGIVARLSGALDANVSLDWQRKADGEGWSNVTSGVAHLREGKAYVEGVGLEFQDVTLDVLATPFGEQTHLAFDRIQARARSEDVNFEGRGQLILTGADVVSGSANAYLRDVPLTLQGQNLGKATGALSAQLERRPAWDVPGPHFGKPYMWVNATLGNWQVRASSSASRSLIDTSSHPDVVVLQAKKSETRGEITPFRIVVNLGRDTEFSLAELDIPISGETQIDYTDTAIVSGTLTLKRGGRVPILGHVFEVQSGALRLNPTQPSNPYIDIMLAGQAKDGTSVNVTLTGSMQDPIVNPPLSQLNDLLGGGAATAVSGGVQALGVNSLLGDTVQFRVGSNENDQQLARYSAAMQIRDRLWFEVNYARTETNAFRTDNNNAISGTLDYRFNDNWSLRTEAGTTGGSVDVVWQYRY